MERAPREIQIQTICLLILSTVAAAAALYWLQPVMIPLVMAVFLAFSLAPLVDLQMRYARLPRPMAVVGTLLLALLIFTVIASLVSTSVTQLAENRDAYQRQIEQLLGSLAEALPAGFLGVDASGTVARLSEIPASTIGSLLVSTTNAIVDVLSQSLLVLIFVVYLLIGGVGGGRPGTGVWSEIEERVKRYAATKGVISAATGILVGSTLGLLGVDLAMVFGLMAFLLNFIPSVGSLVATLLPLPVVLVSPEISATTAVLAIAVPGAIQILIGNVLEPKIMGDSLDLHPIAILMALIFWGMLWGVVGMLLATPITAVLRILFGRLELTRPLAELLAGRIEAGTPDREVP